MCKKKSRHKRAHSVWLHLYKVQRQAKLIDAVRSQNSGYLWWVGGQLQTERSTRKDSGVLATWVCSVCENISQCTL